MIRDSYAIRQRKLKAARELKRKNLDRLLATVDALIVGALKEDSSYHTGELRDLNHARHHIMTIRAGTSSRRQR